MANVLTSWKEIAQYLGKGVRTVQRWEQDFGLPVRRANSTSRHAVLAVPKEIDEWVRCQAQGYDGISESPAQRLRRDMERIRKENAELRLQLEALQFRPHSSPADGKFLADGSFSEVRFPNASVSDGSFSSGDPLLPGYPLSLLREWPSHDRMNSEPSAPQRMNAEQVRLEVLGAQIAVGFILCALAESEALTDARAQAAATLRSAERCIDEIRRQVDGLPVRVFNEIRERLEELNSQLHRTEAQIEGNPRTAVLLASDAA